MKRLPLKIKRTQRYKIFTLIVIVAAIVVGYMLFAYVTNTYPFQKSSESGSSGVVNDINFDKPSKEEQTSPTEVTEDNAPGGTVDPALPAKVIITSAQIDPSGGLRVGVVIQSLSNKGECTLTIRKGTEQVYEQTVGVQALSNSSTCEGFTVEADKLSQGTYVVEVKYKDDGVIKGSDRQEVTTL